jgi:hypothetical protein
MLKNKDEVFDPILKKVIAMLASSNFSNGSTGSNCQILRRLSVSLRLIV